MRGKTKMDYDPETFRPAKSPMFELMEKIRSFDLKLYQNIDLDS